MSPNPAAQQKFLLGQGSTFQCSCIKENNYSAVTTPLTLERIYYALQHSNAWLWEKLDNVTDGAKS